MLVFRKILRTYKTDEPLEVIEIIQLWALENKTAINKRDQKLEKVLGKLKVEQQQSRIEGQVKDELPRWSW